VCLTNTADDENNRFGVLTRCAFLWNSGFNCTKKRRRSGSKRCVFSPV